MKLKDWLNLFSIISSSLLLLFLANSLEIKEKFQSECPVLAHPFLCAKQISLSSAHIADFILIDGLALKTARNIFLYIKENPSAQIDDLLDVSGVGKKTLDKLKEYFY